MHVQLYAKNIITKQSKVSAASRTYLCHILDNNILPCKRCSCYSFLMSIFTMNDWGVISFLVLLNSIPDLHTNLLRYHMNIKKEYRFLKRKKKNHAWQNKRLISAKGTLDTHGQVVSTICTFLSLKVNISSTAAPNAGKTTTSPLLTTSNCFCPSSIGIFCTSISSKRCDQDLRLH